MRPLIAFFFLMVISASLAAGGCEEGYVDEFTVKVVDAKSRAVEGASVEVTYDRGASFGERYHTTPPRYTPEDGKLNYLISIPGTTVREVSCNIVIRASLGEFETEKTIEANRHSENILVPLDLHRVIFEVKNQYYAPIENASVSINGMTKDTDANGRATFFLGTGEYEYLVSYLKGKQSGNLQVDGDVDFEILLEYRPISVEIVDEKGNSLPATVTMGNETYDAPDGLFEHQKVFGDEVELRVDYKGKSRTITASPGEDRKIVSFDLSPPFFENTSIVAEGNLTRLLIKVVDQGMYASGIDYKSLNVRYRMEKEESPTPWSEAKTFAASTDAFMADFQDIPENTVVQFRIEISDNQNNRASIEGRFTPKPIEERESGKEQKKEKNDQEIPILYICGGVFIVILVLIIVSKLKRE